MQERIKQRKLTIAQSETVADMRKKKKAQRFSMIFLMSLLRVVLVVQSLLVGHRLLQASSHKAC